MDTVNLSFNLIDEPWLLAQRHDGTVESLSLTGLFANSSDYTRLLGDIPTQALPILRLALAILHSSIKGPESTEEWGAMWRAGRFPVDDVTHYLNRYRDRFDLLHLQTPFYQVADLQTKKEEASLSAFIADIPTGRPKYAMRAADGLERIDFAEAARWIVHCQAFDLSGIKGAAVGDPRMKGGKSFPIGPGSLGRVGAIYPEGDNLTETLLLNLIPDEFLDEHGAEIDPGDVPVWERGSHGPAPEERDSEGTPLGLLDLYTWQSRRLNLVFDESGVTGAIICQGDKLELRDQFKTEPMAAWRRSKNQERQLKMGRAVYLPRQHNPSRNIWRGLAAALPATTGRPTASDDALPPLALLWVARTQNSGALARDRRIKYHITGIAYGTQEAVINDLVDDSLSLAAAVFDTEHPELATAVTAAAADAEKAVSALAALARDLARAAGDRDNVAGVGQTAAEAAYATLDTEYRQWLARLSVDIDTDRERASWQQTVGTTVLDLAARLAASSGTAAWKGRKEGDFRRNSAAAEIAFRRSIRAALPLAFPERTEAKGTD
ncbi:type I-E CRISPR-associated protein Cse1/CasA [Glycomyces sp. L485]|uniref:type I-E CRISPR-associated protein Cse1/CasA n=1 Tax=Glycomyces sp. L485 TaxID=2909235 RepID=UPI001F4AAAF8|nr:type I-E CRISPR-associated protein Cse1/CasA [Glycomyces sp. L485]